MFLMCWAYQIRWSIHQSIFTAAYICLTNSQQAKKPIVPVMQKKLYETMAMYPKYMAIGT
jgi:hypothetical protein